MTVVISEAKPTGRISLRVAPDDVSGLDEILGFTLPAKIGERVTQDGRDALCVGPDEWTVTLPAGDTTATIALIGEAEVTASAVDISDRETTLTVSGDQVDALLAMGIPIDVAAMAPGTGTRTVFTSVPVTVWRDTKQLVRLDVWRSFTPQVLQILKRGAAELEADAAMRAA